MKRAVKLHQSVKMQGEDAVMQDNKASANTEKKKTINVKGKGTWCSHDKKTKKNAFMQKNGV